MPVFIVDAERKPLAPCHAAVARKLLASHKAAVLRRYPFTIILKCVVQVPHVPPLRLKIDPGSRVTGLAVVNDATGQVPFAAEVEHRGLRVRAALRARSAVRHARRHRKTQYRKRRFHNRSRRAGWLPPSLESRVANIETWVGRLRRFAPIGAMSLELTRFDTQLMQNPEISGAEYQHGDLAGYEVREYLLEKWDRRCAYCGAESIPLQVEHIHPTSAGGTNRVANLCLACEKCNQAKGAQAIEVFLVKDPELLQKLLAQAKVPLRDAACANTARWEIFRRLKVTGLPLETGTGGRTKFNRTRRSLPKAHWLDAACVGASTPEQLHVEGVRPLVVKAMGHGRRQRCLPDQSGFPRGHSPKGKSFFGFQTGDIVQAVISTGKFAGRHVGRVAVRSRPSFRLLGFDVHPKYLVCLQKTDGYDYGTEVPALVRRAERQRTSVGGWTFRQ